MFNETCDNIDLLSSYAVICRRDGKSIIVDLDYCWGICRILTGDRSSWSPVSWAFHCV